MIQEVSPDEVQKAIMENNGTIVLDVRTVEEYGRGHLKSSINLPVDQLMEKVEKLLPDKSNTIYVYCLSGSRSEVATEAMSQMGYTKVFNMAGGVLVWRLKRFPME